MKTGLLVGFASGVALALVIGLVFVRVGPFYRYYDVLAFGPSAKAAGVDFTDAVALRGHIAFRQSELLARGCEPVTAQEHSTMRCPFWITP